MTTMITQRKSSLRMTTLGQLRRRQWPEREDIIAPWLRDGESVMLWAPVGLGKSMLALTVALMVAGGGKVCGWGSPKPRPVLYVDGEMHIHDIYDRLAMLGQTVEGLDMEAVDRNLVVMARTDQDPEAEFPDLATREGQDAVLSRAASINAELVICDNFSTLAEVPDENEASAMNTVLGFLMRMKQAGRATALVHHSDKAEGDYRGSSKLAATFEVIIGLFRLPGRSMTDGTGFELRWRKLRGKPGPTTRDAEMTLMEDGGVVRWDVKPSAKSEILMLLDAAQSGQFTTQQQIAGHLQWRKDKVTRLRNQAISRGLISRATWNAYLDGEGAEMDGPGDF